MRMRLFWVLSGICLLAAPAGAQGAQAAAATPTFNKDVAPILYANCIACHREGEIAPMQLISYQEVRPWAKGIKAKVASREMPPWFADPRYGKFKNARGLTQAQIDMLVAWVDAGAPQGTGTAPALPNVVTDSAAGTLKGFMERPADAVIEGPFEAHIPAVGDFTGIDVWNKHPFTEDKNIEAAELRPRNRAVTHHMQAGAAPLPRGATHLGLGPAWRGGPMVNAVPVREDGTPLLDANANLSRAELLRAQQEVGQETEEATANTEGFNFATRLLFYAPGAGAVRYAPGLVKTIRKDDYISWNIHYNATGRPETDRPELRLWFSQVEPTHYLKSATVNHVNLYEGKEIVGRRVQRENIPAHAENYRVASVFSIGYDSELNSMWTHMHMRGKDMTFSVTYPDGREEILLSVPHYSFNWQVIYALEEPVKIPAGSVLRAVAHYDNSANNKFNPTPDQELPWGGQSWHEMYFPYFDLAISKEVDKIRGDKNDCENEARTACLSDRFNAENPVNR
jgi:hypothetical protein